MSLFTVEDTALFTSDQLLMVAKQYFPDLTLDPDYLLLQLQAAESEISQRLRVYLEPTMIFPVQTGSGTGPVTPALTADQLALIPNGENGEPIPYDYEPGYDYGPDFFQNDTWGRIVLRQKPVQAIYSIVLAYPAPTQGFYTIPNDWIRADFKYGTLSLVPASATTIAPLGAFVLSALGGGSTVPFMIQVTYQAGLLNVRDDPKWANLLNAIYKLAVVNVIEGFYLPQSGSTSADGLSISQSLDTSKYRDVIELILNGPPNCNGGLKARIHGISMTVAGSLA